MVYEPSTPPLIANPALQENVVNTTTYRKPIGLQDQEARDNIATLPLFAMLKSNYVTDSK